MYVLMCHTFLKTFALRGVKGDGSYDVPDDWTVIDDGIEGFLDAVAVMEATARREGWRNWTLSVEDYLR